MKAQLPRTPFYALVCGKETVISGSVDYGGMRLYRTEGFGLVRASAITVIPAPNWGGKKQVPLDQYDLETNAPRRPPRPMWSAPAGPRFDPEAFRAGIRQTARSYYRDRRDRTRNWLRAGLSEGVSVLAVEILRQAREDGVPLRSLRRAKKFLGIVSFKKGGRNGREGAVWFWSLP